MKRFICLLPAFSIFIFFLNDSAKALGSGDIVHGSKVFTYTGSVQTFKVPYTTTISIEVYGAAGGKAICCNFGYGGFASGSLAVKQNKFLYIYVGGQGAKNDSLNGLNGGGGFNGGGGGGINGYGGGGASDVRVGSNSYRHVVIAAGAGGGTSDSAGGLGSKGRGGGGGGLVGGNGTSTQYGEGACATFAAGGAGGTQSAGGAGGTYEHYFGEGEDGFPGAKGVGGRGGGHYSGGGGGGYYGGGGGANPQCPDYGSGGGGGSSYIGGVTNGSTRPAINGPEGKYGGNGYVIITW